MRSIAKMDGSYVMALFDCCRERVPVTETRGSGNDGDEEGVASAGNGLPES